MKLPSEEEIRGNVNLCSQAIATDFWLQSTLSHPILDESSMSSIFKYQNDISAIDLICKYLVAMKFFGHNHK